MSNAPHDILDVQDQIKKLKIKRSSLLAENSEIKAEIEKYEANRRALKNELNVLVPLGELRFVRDVEDANSSSGNGDEYGRALCPIADKVHFDMDRKLELQILNSEIRGALHGLERSAVQLELGVHKEERIVERSVTKLLNIPAVFEKSTADFSYDIEDGIEAKMKLKNIMSLEVENKRKEKKMLTIAIGKLREQIEDIREIKEMQKRNREKANLNLKNELNRIDVLKREEDKLKELITTFK